MKQKRKAAQEEYTALVFTAWVNYERLLLKNVEVGNMEAAEPRLVVIYEAASTTADISSPAETLIFMLSLRADFFFPLKWFSKCSESTFKKHYIASCLLCLRASGSSWIL